MKNYIITVNNLYVGVVTLTPQEVNKLISENGVGIKEVNEK